MFYGIDNLTGIEVVEPDCWVTRIGDGNVLRRDIQPMDAIKIPALARRCGASLDQLSRLNVPHFKTVLGACDDLAAIRRPVQGKFKTCIIRDSMCQRFQRVQVDAED